MPEILSYTVNMNINVYKYSNIGFCTTSLPPFRFHQNSCLNLPTTTEIPENFSIASDFLEL